MAAETNGATFRSPIEITDRASRKNPERPVGFVDVDTPFAKLSFRVNQLIALLGGTSVSFDNDSSIYSLGLGIASFEITKRDEIIEDASFTYSVEKSVRIEFGSDGNPSTFSEQVACGKTRYEGPTVEGAITDETIVTNDMESVMSELEQRAGMKDYQKSLRTASIMNHEDFQRREKPRRLHTGAVPFKNAA